MSKGQKRRDAERKQNQKWVIVYQDLFDRDALPIIVSDPMPYDEAHKAMQKEQEGYDPAFDCYSLHQIVSE